MRFENWKQWARALKREVRVLFLACKDQRTPWYAKALAVCVVGYALSPIDLIPDPIPVIGYLDDLILVPVGIWIVRRLIPAEVLGDCRRQAEVDPGTRPRNWIAGGIILFIWIITLALLIRWTLTFMQSSHARL